MKPMKPVKVWGIAKRDGELYRWKGSEREWIFRTKKMAESVCVRSNGEHPKRVLITEIQRKKAKV